ncbi:hypothetical protein F8M41_010176 [Gigaspora margarita]|uniref:Uncharacterized protein n=1 Tax=Gigaspora margarita TaxID=4874 RepID=A0A8H4EQ82_GIGMA|nr:hypothetical protein F8M41_010176 [Gigaspora margarita]
MLDEQAKKISVSQQTRKRYYDDMVFFCDVPRPEDLPDWAYVAEEDEVAHDRMKEQKRRKIREALKSIEILKSKEAEKSKVMDKGTETDKGTESIKAQNLIKGKQWKKEKQQKKGKQQKKKKQWKKEKIQKMTLWKNQQKGADFIVATMINKFVLKKKRVQNW